MPRLLVLGYFSTVIQLNKLAHFVRWDAYTRGGFAIMPYVPAPVIEKLCPLGKRMSTKSNFILMAEYNKWMNASIYSAASNLSSEELAEDRGAFFDSISWYTQSYFGGRYNLA